MISPGKTITPNSIICKHGDSNSFISSFEIFDELASLQFYTKKQASSFSSLVIVFISGFAERRSVKDASVQESYDLIYSAVKTPFGDFFRSALDKLQLLFPAILSIT